MGQFLVTLHSTNNMKTLLLLGLVVLASCDPDASPEPEADADAEASPWLTYGYGLGGYVYAGYPALHSGYAGYPAGHYIGKREARRGYYGGYGYGGYRGGYRGYGGYRGFGYRERGKLKLAGDTMVVTVDT